MSSTRLNTNLSSCDCTETRTHVPRSEGFEVTNHRGDRVSVFSSHSFWTSSSLDVPAGVTQEEGHTGFLIHLLSAVRALIFLTRRIQPFLSLVDREVELLTIYSLSTRWAFLFLFFSFLVRKIPFAGIELTSQRVRGSRCNSELPGRPCASLFPHLLFFTRSIFFIGMTWAC